MSDTEKPNSPWPMERGEDAVRKLEYIWKFLQDKRKFHIETGKSFKDDLRKNASQFLETVEGLGDGADFAPIVRSQIQKLQEWLECFARFRGEELATFDCRITYQAKLKPKVEIGDRKQ